MYTNPVAIHRAAAAATAPSASAANSSTSTGTSTSSSSSGTGMDSMFMQLLITQLQNQDPLSPMDPSTFVTQLVGVNSLDQISQINQLLQSTLGSS
jgi:flagellar basal-body rod modification protein FlgD